MLLCDLKSHLLQYISFRFADSMRLIHVSAGISGTTEDEINCCAAKEGKEEKRKALNKPKMQMYVIDCIKQVTDAFQAP